MPRSLAEIIWYTLAAVFLTIGIVGTLGEYVFHWWREPFDFWGPASLAVGLIALASGSSSEEMREFREEFLSQSGKMDTMLGKQDQMLAKQDQMLGKMDQFLAGQAEQTLLLREMVASFRAR